MCLLNFLFIWHNLLNWGYWFDHLPIAFLKLLHLFFVFFNFGCLLHFLHQTCLVICLHFFEFSILNFNILAHFFIFWFKHPSSGIILIQVLLADVLYPLFFDEGLENFLAPFFAKLIMICRQFFENLFLKSLDNGLQRRNLILVNLFLCDLWILLGLAWLVNLKIDVLLSCFDGLNTRFSNLRSVLTLGPFSVQHLNLRNYAEHNISDSAKKLIILDGQNSKLLIILEKYKLVDAAESVEWKVELLKLPELVNAWVSKDCNLIVRKV